MSIHVLELAWKEVRHDEAMIIPKIALIFYGLVLGIVQSELLANSFSKYLALFLKEGCFFAYFRRRSAAQR